MSSENATMEEALVKGAEEAISQAKDALASINYLAPRGEVHQSLIDTDWGLQWKEEQGEYHADDNAAYWDNRAPKFGTKRGISPYVLAFIDHLALDPDDSVFDMGCGNGALAIPLAKAGHKVIARDFSRGMLDALKEEMEAQGVTGIDYAQMSWEDDWEACGIGERIVDVAFASRSIITSDLKASLEKLSKVARKRACVTVSTNATPHTSSDILRSLGATYVKERDSLYTFAILIQLGYHPEVSYILSQRCDAYEDREDAAAALERMIVSAEPYISKEDACRCRENLPAWLDENLVPNENAGRLNSHNEVEGPWRLAVPREVRWAFISWEV
ncbi:MAG: methyltransferase domain-containing protein [Eggerthellaceae bacterium]|nr:methyltransferase domain-containing protein [Eggerthellaceae bacterium]